ncbi:MAG: HEAT repeat domain-containing protein [Geothrix sp.]|uniref:HEAT repeat domain-containing protein n=1 Tax=Geothrix sp. TaxID=1962974 RepID=UPI003BAED215
MRQNPFEMFLDRLDPTWRGDQLAFFRTLADVGRGAVPELAERVLKASCPAAMRQLVLEASFYHPWPEWIPVTSRLLRHEKDLGVFESGARALGRMGTPEALEALRELAPTRATQPFRDILDLVLRESDPAEAFHHHFARLLQGSAQPADANEGAHQLAKLLTPEALEPIRTLASHPDLLVYRHALRLLGQIQSPEAADCLLELLEEAHQDAMADREVRSQLTAFRAMSRPDVQVRLVQLLVQRWEPKDPVVAVDLGSDQPERVQSAVRTIRDGEPGLFDSFLLDTLVASQEEKPAHLARHLGQAGEQAAQRARRLEFALDATAQGLAELADQGFIDPQRLLNPLAECLRRNTGRTGVASALARLVPVTSEELLDLLVQEADGALRMAALEVLGERRDPALRATLLKLRRDPISDLAQRALWHLGQLPDPEGLALERLGLADPEEIQVGLRFIAMHQLDALVPQLLELVASEPQEAILLATLETLGALGSAQAVDPLLNLLHSGQNARVQVALAQALRDLGDPACAIALCAKAAELASPELHTLAVESLARAHATAHQPLPLAQTHALDVAVRAAWNTRQPSWPLRRRIGDALVALHLEHGSSWVDFANLIQETLHEKRPSGTVPTEDLAHLQTAARALTQKAQG